MMPCDLATPCLPQKTQMKAQMKAKQTEEEGDAVLNKLNQDQQG